MSREVECQYCDGTGKVKKSDPGFGITYQLEPCPKCNGTGKQILR